MVLSFWYAINFLALQDTRSFPVSAHLLAFFSSSAASALASWNSLIAWNLSGISSLSQIGHHENLLCFQLKLLGSVVKKTISEISYEVVTFVMFCTWISFCTSLIFAARSASVFSSSFVEFCSLKFDRKSLKRWEQPPADNKSLALDIFSLSSRTFKSSTSRWQNWSLRFMLNHSKKCEVLTEMWVLTMCVSLITIDDKWECQTNDT